MVFDARRCACLLVCSLAILGILLPRPLGAEVQLSAQGIPPVGGGVAAALLWDQSTGCSSSSTASQRFTNLNGALLQSADDFVVPPGQQWTLQRVNASGMFPLLGAATDGVDVLIYANSPAGSSGSPSGAPGTLVCSSTALIPAGGPGSPQFALDLTPSCLLGPGVYWLSVVSNQDSSTDGQWFWFERAGQMGFPFHVQDPNGLIPICPSWDTAAVCGLPSPEPDLCFSLEGQAVISDIPVMGTVGLWILALLLATTAVRFLR